MQTLEKDEKNNNNNKSEIQAKYHIPGRVPYSQRLN
jgi:hypothetical protein